jgi:hypothetical protein
VSDKVHKAVGYQDANIKASVSANMWSGTSPSVYSFTHHYNPPFDANFERMSRSKNIYISERGTTR